MANTLTGLTPLLYQALNEVSREQAGLTMNVARDVSAESVAVGQTVTVPVAPASVAADITPGATSPATGSQVIGKVDMTITKSRAVPVLWNGEEMKGTALVDRIMVDQFAEAFRTLTNEVEADLAADAVANAGGTVGTDTTVPFGTAGVLTDFALVSKYLDDAGAPGTNRFLAVSSAPMANLRGIQSVLFKVNEAGSSDNLRRGIIGDVQGLSISQSYGLTAAGEDDSVGWYKNAIQLLVRSPAMPSGGDGASDVMDLYDPNSGLSFQIALYRQYRQIHIEIGLAWGTKVLKPSHVVTLLG